MFMLRNVSNYLFTNNSKETIFELPQGQLYLVRPLSPKGYSELLFRDSAASVRRTVQQFQYQLVVQRIFEEGEAELLTEEDGLDLREDEKTFLLDESLHLRVQVREGGETVIAWRDLSGDENDLFEFVCDRSIKASDVEQFEELAAQCQYERKYGQSYTAASREDLRQFTFAEQPIPTASISPIEPMATKATAPATKATAPATKTTTAPTAVKPPQAREVLANEVAELHLFDFESGTFLLQDSEVKARVSETGKWQYWLQIGSDKRDWLGRDITPDLNPVFNFEYLSFIFNHYTDDSAFSWLLKLPDRQSLERFQQGIMQALWEHLHETKWQKVEENEREYVLDAFNDLVLEKEQEEEEEEDEDSDDSREADEEYDSDESQDNVDTQGGKEANSQLAVGYKHDRSFVVRGDKIGVFRHTPDNHLKFDTAIAGVKTPKGKAFSPKKVMLHVEDSNMVMQNPDNPNALYRMDLETGKVVDEWRVHDDIPVINFAPSSKYAQMTADQTLLGLSSNGLFRIDPRQSGNKLAESTLKQYASKNDFSAAATTDKGYIAVASNKGDIRMFDRLGINAKTHIPALGDPITGIDVSADGRWLLATTKTYLLLIDAMQKEGKNEGKLGFERSFGKDAKPQPRRLTIKPSHVAQMQHETKAPLNFTAAHFNAGGDETTIITASGPFVITWNLKQVLRGAADSHKLRRYEEVVKADNFRYGTDKSLIVALPNEVDMIKKSKLQRVTRESIAGDVHMSPRSSLQTPARARGSHLRNQIVDSPY